MKKQFAVMLLGVIMLLMTGCSNIAEKAEVGQGEIKLVNSTIKADDNILEFTTNDIDETKTVFVNVANTVVFSEKIKNDEVYQLDISDVKDARRTDYKPRVQLFQTKDDTEDGDLVTFKQVRYKVEK